MPDTAPPKKPEAREIASIVGYGRDITRSYLGPLLEPQDKVLRQRWFDYEIYEEILRDDQVKAVFQQRRSAVVSREWDVTPGGESRQDKAAAAFIRETLMRIRWDNVTDKMLFGVFYGFAVGECIYAYEDGKVQLNAIKVRKQRRFRFDWEMQPRLLTWDKMTDGEILPERKFWHYSIGADNDDEPYGLGLGHWLYWPNYFKRNGLKSWLKFLERFAQPTAKGTYQPGTGKEDLTKLKAALYAFGEDAAMMVPEGMMVELIEASRSGTADYSGFADHLDSAIAKVILSQTMTTDNGSSRSQAEVHSGVKLEVIKSDADLIDASANATWVRWLVDWNFPGAAYPTISRKLEDEENLNDRATRDKNLSDMGFRLTPEKVVEVYGDGYYDPASLEDESADQPPLVSVLGVGGTEALVGFLTALSQMSLKRENAIATLTTVFGISQSDAEAMVPEDAAPEAAAPPASIDAAAALFSEAPPDLLKALEPIGQQFAENAELSDRAFAVLQVLDQSVEVDMLTFAETQSNAAMEGAIGRRLLALIRPGVVEFASGGRRKCGNNSLSCGGSCQPLFQKNGKATVCKKDMTPVQRQQYKALVKAVKAGGDGADKAMEDFQASLKSESSSDFKQPNKTTQSQTYEIPESGRDAVNASDIGQDFGFDAINEFAGFSMTNILGSPSIEQANEMVKRKIADGFTLEGTNGRLLAEVSDNAAMRAFGATSIDDGRNAVLAWDGDKLTPLTAADKKTLAEARKMWELHQEAFSSVEDIQTEVSIASIIYDRSKSKTSKILAGVADELKAHKAATKKLWAAEDKALGRTPSKQNRKQLEDEVKAEAKAWAKSMGFTEGGVNGFSADATKAHDIAHPATHRLAGLDSPAINKAFGNLKDADGKPSLLAEEALVNIVEHLSRGDTSEASIQNGLRLAKVLSRNSTEKERRYVRSPEFARGIIDLVDNRIRKNNEYSNLMPIVRDHNTIAGTVTTSGSDFSASASGG
jgi:hypothetical protein